MLEPSYDADANRLTFTSAETRQMVAPRRSQSTAAALTRGDHGRRSWHRLEPRTDRAVRHTDDPWHLARARLRCGPLRCLRHLSLRATLGPGPIPPRSTDAGANTAPSSVETNALSTRTARYENMTKVLITGGAGFIGSTPHRRAARAGALRPRDRQLRDQPPGQSRRRQGRPCRGRGDDRRRGRRRSHLQLVRAGGRRARSRLVQGSRCVDGGQPHERRRHGQRRARRRGGGRETTDLLPDRALLRPASARSSRSRCSIRSIPPRRATRSRRPPASSTSA